VHGIDFAGAVLTVLGLAGVIAGLTAGPEQGWTSPVVVISLVGGILALVAFVVVEQHSAHPLVPLAIFKAKQKALRTVFRLERADDARQGNVEWRRVIRMIVIHGLI